MDILPQVTPQVTICLDSSHLLRYLLAFCWGIGWCVALDYSKWGIRFQVQHPFAIYVAGVFGVMVVAFAMDWTSILLCLALAGLAARLAMRDQAEIEELGRNRRKHAFEDAIALVLRIRREIQKLLETGGLDGATITVLSRILGAVHRLESLLKNARNGRYQE